ncbi:hypothetical protein [uncultured Hoeflea sp.]|nr:hypothetical protein [uncultured Hoeflea sp.]
MSFGLCICNLEWFGDIFDHTNAMLPNPIKLLHAASGHFPATVDLS